MLMIISQCLISFAPITIFAVYQWTLTDSRLSAALSVLTLVLLLTGILPPTLHILFLRFRSQPITPTHYPVYAPLITPYRPSRILFFLLPLLATALRAALLSSANTQSNGLAQALALLAIESLLLLAHVVLRPHRTRAEDVWGAGLAGVRVVGAGLLLVFVGALGVSPIPRVVVGILMAVVWTGAVVAVGVSVGVQVVRAVRAVWRSRKERGLEGEAEDKAGIGEKGKDERVGDIEEGRSIDSVPAEVRDMEAEEHSSGRRSTSALPAVPEQADAHT
jgi:Transient receptor potential (TRP) ion channel